MGSNRRNSDPSGTTTYADPKPRLATLKQQRDAQRNKDELSGEKQKREVSKVTLPKFSWDK